MRGNSLIHLAPEHRLLLQAALGPPALAGKAWREWRLRFEFDAIDSVSQRLLPLLARRDGIIPTDDVVLGRVKGLYRKAWARNQSLWASVRPAVEAIERCQIPILPVGRGRRAQGAGATPTRDIA